MNILQCAQAWPGCARVICDRMRVRAPYAYLCIVGLELGNVCILQIKSQMPESKIFSSRAPLPECHSKVHANQLDLAFQQLGGIMLQAASE